MTDKQRFIIFVFVILVLMIALPYIEHAMYLYIQQQLIDQKETYQILQQVIR